MPSKKHRGNLSEEEVCQSKILRRLLLLFFWIILAAPEFSLLQAQNISPRFQHLDIREGLSQSTVYDSYQDKEGFMWFGTRDGLNRYDGIDFTIFRKETGTDSTTLEQNTVRAISGDKNGDIWIGTDGGGLYRYSKQTKQFEHITSENESFEAFETSNVLSFDFSSDTDLWIGTRNQGLLKYDVNNSKLTNVANEFGQIWALAADSISATIWAGTDRGLVRISPDGNIKTFLSSTRIESINIDGKTIWIGTYEDGLYRYRINSEKLNRVKDLPDDISVLSLLNIDDKLWIGTVARGIFIWDKKSGNLRNYSSKNTPNSNLTDNSIRSLFKDRTGTVWVGSNNAGLFTWSKFRRKFALYQYDENDSNSLSSNVVLSFTEDNEERLWIGTDGGGVNVLDREQQEYTYFTGENSSGYDINNSHVITMLTDEDGTVWIGTDGGGLNKWDPESKTFEYFLHKSNDPRSLSDNSVLTLLKDSRGFLWVGTYQGLNRFDPRTETFRRTGLSDNNSAQLNDDRILALLEDRERYIWIGTYADGLKRLNPRTGNITHFAYQPEDSTSISSNRVQSLYEDGQNNLWIGTYNGLNRYDKENDKFEVFTTADGLANNVVYGILPDEDGKLWLSTNKGITRFDPQTRHVANFTVYDGLQSQEFNGGAYYKNKNGELFFGGVSGFNVIDPQNISLNTLKPPVEITSFNIAGDSKSTDFETGKPVRLSYDQNFFTFEFAALDFVAPESNIYRYKLEGFDKSWIESKTKNTARYTNVPPGEYNFKVQAANSDDIWNRSGAGILLKISPPFWQTGWFRIFVLLMVSTFLYGLYRYRINAVLKVERTRQRIASDLHDEVSATLSSISYFSQAVKRENNNNASKKYLSLITESANEAKEKISDIIWSIDPDNDDWVNLLSKCRRFASDLFDSKEIDYQLDIDTDIAAPLNIELRQHLWFIFKEMVTNAARHSEAGKVRVCLGVKGDILELIIQDDGVGMESEVAKILGQGIKNIKQRARQLGAELKLETDNEIGTRWIMTLKIL